MLDKQYRDKKTKVIATFGPACDNKSILKNMILNGVDLFRINASHLVDHVYLNKVVKLIRKTSKEVDKPCGLMLDLQGPKIRIGRFNKPEVNLVVGDEFSLTTKDVVGDSACVSVSYKGLVDDVEIGDQIFINDGLVRLKVVSKREDTLVTTVKRGGIISDHKGLNLPDTNMAISAISEKDQDDLVVACKLAFDYVALSFVSDAQDVLNLRGLLDEAGGKDVKIIAKIELQQAVDNLIEIIDQADAVMVARGDLGVEVGVENVPRLQKHIVRKANKRIIPVIVATQMLESMIHQEVSTRAEVSDVANAIYDRCDAVMLSGETAVGVSPLRVISVMKHICHATDLHMEEIKREDLNYRQVFTTPTRVTSFCRAADQIAEENDADAIMVFTSSGTTPLIASKLNSILPIIAPTDEAAVCSRMSLYRGVFPLLLPKKFKDIFRWTDMINMSLKAAMLQGLLKKGDVVVVTAGRPIGVSNGINSIRIVTV